MWYVDQFSQICKATIKEKGEKSGGDTWERLKGRLFEFQKYEINTLKRKPFKKNLKKNFQIKKKKGTFSLPLLCS